MHLNEQLLITYECVSAVGTSLDLKQMIEHFLKVFSRKTGSLASVYWCYDAPSASHNPLCFYGKKAFEPMLVLQSRENFSLIEDKTHHKSTLHVKVAGDWLVFLFNTQHSDLLFIKAVIASFLPKLENAIYACKNHLELLEINKNLSQKIEEELEKNRQKDQHILQQSRLAQMGEMISMIAHQWRQPLGSISAVVAGLKLKFILNKFDLNTPEGQEAHKRFVNEALHKIEEYVRFLTNTIDDFRNFFKPNKHQEMISIVKLVERTLEIIGKALEINGIAIRVEAHSHHEILTHANEVTQVILNILKNAEDVIKERHISPAHIFIRISEKNGAQCLEIEDNAGGIPPEVLPHIFEPYFSTKHEKNGTGLGLYMSKVIIEDHCQGSIAAHNTDVGAAFSILLRSEV